MSQLGVAPSHYGLVYYMEGRVSEIVCHIVLEYTLLPFFYPVPSVAICNPIDILT
jgi:hypothetical protein